LLPEQHVLVAQALGKTPDFLIGFFQCFLSAGAVIDVGHQDVPT
jgi:hypothetical protein